MKILYVEDNPANLYLVKRVAMGHEVINYIDGEEALANFTRDEPDLVLMDIQLAGDLNGLDVVRKLRTDGHKIPIIAVTAYAMIGDRERCLAAGCDDYIAKPLPISQLLDIFNRYDAEYKAARAASEARPTPAETATAELPVDPTQLTQEAEPVPSADLETPTAASMDSSAPRPDHATETAAISLVPPEPDTHISSLNGASGTKSAPPETPGAEAG